MQHLHANAQEHIQEVKALANPPAGVRLACEGVCIMLLGQRETRCGWLLFAGELMSLVLIDSAWELKIEKWPSSKCHLHSWDLQHGPGFCATAGLFFCSISLEAVLGIL